MLSHLDFIIFPNRCEVIKLPSQRYFYPIFKNGSSSVTEQAKKSKWRIYLNEQIKRIPEVDVVVRDPRQRFVSGVNSFVTQTMQANPELDRNTVYWFAKKYLHINRHYCMQFSWLLNLARYLDPDAKINLSALDYIKQVTDRTSNYWGAKDENFSNELANLPEQEMYDRIDQVLVNAVGQSLTFSEIIELLQTQDPVAYTQVIVKAQNILNPTYVVPKT